MSAADAKSGGKIETIRGTPAAQMGFQKGNTLGQKFGRDKDPRTGQEKTTEVLRKKKTLRERLLLLAETPVENSRGEKMASEDVIAVQLRNKAAKGDLKAIRLYAELTGQLTQQVEISGEQPLQIFDWEKRDK